MAISKVIYKTSPQDSGTVWMDATQATAEAGDITAPKTALIASGQMVTGTGSGGSASANVKSFGAKGDGVTDDTEALESAVEYGYENNVPVMFPEGTYMVRRPLTLRSNMEIYGVGNAIIKSMTSTTTDLTVMCSEGDETITVDSTSGFQVGDSITISSDYYGSAAARYCSVGYITAISGNTITFESAYDSVKTGAVKQHEVGCLVTNACAIFRSWGMLYECENVYIHNLTLDGNKQNDEWSDWLMGCIHIDACDYETVCGITYNKVQINPTFRDLIILSSHYDGISDQGIGGGTVENCKIENPHRNGIHFGTSYAGANVLNNIIEGAELGAGVFWCSGAEDIIVEGNRITGCNKGCSDYEYGTAGNKSIVTGNIFTDINSYVFDFSLGSAADQGTLIFSNNIIVDPNSSIARFKNRNKVVFANNVINSLESGISNLFDCTGSDKISFVGNIAPNTQATIISGSPTNVINSLNSWN